METAREARYYALFFPAFPHLRAFRYLRLEFEFGPVNGGWRWHAAGELDLRHDLPVVLRDDEHRFPGQGQGLDLLETRGWADRASGVIEA